MPSQRSPPLPPAAPELRQAPGAFPHTPEASEDTQVSSDLNSLSQAVKARRAEYTRRKEIKVRIGTWNVATLSGTEDDVGKWFTEPLIPTKQAHDDLENASFVVGADDEDDDQNSNGNTTPRTQPPIESLSADETSRNGEDIDIYVLGLQEVVDISSPSEALRPYVDPAPSSRWKDALRKALPPSCELVSSQQLMGLLLLVYAAPSVLGTISSVSSSSVGTGLMGYMGNKGGVATRIVLGGTTRVVFLNCHMAAGADKTSLDRRNWDAEQVLLRTKFDPVERDDDMADKPSHSLGQEDFAFWFGDLNYRLDGIPGEDVRRLLHLHTEGTFRPSLESSRPSVSSDDNGRRPLNSSEDTSIALEDNDIEPHLDPTSLHTTIASLLPHDQLHGQQNKRNAFHQGWREGPIDFLPSYKYDVGRVGKFDSSEKQRSPSWCDRILYRTRYDHLDYLRKISEEEEAKKRDEEMKRLGLEQTAEDDGVLFDYDPESDGAQDVGDYDENEDDVAAAGADQGEDSDVAVDIGSYTSHQNIVSSDHKPIHADFTLTYDAVDPALKAIVHQKVVRELDRAENEARPDITVVVEQPPGTTYDGAGPDKVVKGPDTVDFGPVRYDEPVARTMTLANTGGVSATFSFRYRPGGKGEEADDVSPSWLCVSVDWASDGEGAGSDKTPKYTLAPGEAAQVRLVLRINDMPFVRDLTRGNTDIQDILVLRVDNGRDHFISVRGQWLPTCFGLSLLELTRIPQGGIRELDSKSRSSVLGEEGQNTGARMSAPRELFRLTEAVAELTERAVAEWGMVGENFQDETCPWISERTGWPFDSETWTHGYGQHNDRQKLLSSVREAIDTGASFSSQFPPEVPARYRVELLSETLLSFLRSMQEGLVTEHLWRELERQILAREKARRGSLVDQDQSWIMETLSSSPPHSVSLTFITLMLNRVAGETAPIPPSATSPPVSPSMSKASSIPTSPSASSTLHSEPATDASSSTTASSSNVNSSSFSFPFRFKSRSRGLSSSGSTESEPTSAAPANAVASGKPSPELDRRQVVNKSFARIFADVIFSSGIAPPEKEKERKAWQERKMMVLEAFLTGDGH